LGRRHDVGAPEEIAASILASFFSFAHDTLSKIPGQPIPVPPLAVTEVKYNEKYAYLPLEWLVAEVNTVRQPDRLQYPPLPDTDAPADATKDAYDKVVGYFLKIVFRVVPLDLFLADRVIPPQPEATGRRPCLQRLFWGLGCSASDSTQPKVVFASPNQKNADEYNEWIKQGGESGSFRRWIAEKNEFECEVVDRHRENLGTT